MVIKIFYVVMRKEVVDIVKKILLDLQSRINARNMERTLLQEMDCWQVVISPHPDQTAEFCRMHHPQILLMEVTGYTPWTLSERMNLRERLHQSNPDCKLVLMVDERADQALADEVTLIKRDGLIDAYILGSVDSPYYLTSTLNSL